MTAIRLSFNNAISNPPTVSFAPTITSGRVCTKLARNASPRAKISAARKLRLGFAARPPAQAPAANGCSGTIVSGPDSSNASCNARTTVSTCSRGITQEILIGEVEIISMFRPWAARTPNTLARRPPGASACRHRRSRPCPCPRRRSTPSTPHLPAARATRARRAGASRGTVNEISARPPPEAGTFWSIMSTSTPASANASKMLAATPGL